MPLPPERWRCGRVSMVPVPNGTAKLLSVRQQNVEVAPLPDCIFRSFRAGLNFAKLWRVATAAHPVQPALRDEVAAGLALWCSGA